MQTRDGFPVRRGKGVLPGGPDTYIGYGPNWANVSNTPFREYKHWQHEGGISTPLIAHWPKGISNDQHNKLNATPTHLIDIMATCVDLARASYPKEYRGNAIQSFEGVSLAAAFQGDSVERRKPIFWEHEGNRAIRMGEWKLVSKHPRGWELYNITTDRTEMNDLAAEQPERVKDMAEQWDVWTAQTIRGRVGKRVPGCRALVAISEKCQKRNEEAYAASIKQWEASFEASNVAFTKAAFDKSR